MTLLVFDGDCAFCQRCVDLGHDRLPYMPETKAWQLIDLDTLGLTRDQVTASVRLVGPESTKSTKSPNGLHASGARAIALVLAMQPHRGWRAAGHAMLVPPISWLAEGVYRIVARNRHRLPGSTPACAVR